MKKIVHIIGDLSIGGTERALSSLLINFPNKELKYYVISLSGNGYFSDEIKKPFEKVVDSIIQTRDLSMSPLFQVMFVLHNTPEKEGHTLEQVISSQYILKDNYSKYDLTFTLEEKA